VERACGSVYLVREACYRACEQVGIYKRQKLFVSIEQSINVGTILKGISESGVDYPGQILGLLGLEDIQLSEREREEGLKDWVLRVLFCVTAKDMRKGITLKKLRCPCRKPYPAWQSIENRTMIVRNEGSLQAHWLDGCRSDPVAGNA
jgi:hypothetical protein